MAPYDAVNAALFSLMESRSDLTYHINYLYQDSFYTVKVPAGADLASIHSTDGYVGLRQVDLVFHGNAGTYQAN